LNNIQKEENFNNVTIDDNNNIKINYNINNPEELHFMQILLIQKLKKIEN